ncbi:MAG: TrkH family potassium uptake protein [Muribaculaceae bacterium]|nr:TrkH family potassium uptake protein [Muribaculaceae bacterium]
MAKISKINVRMLFRVIGILLFFEAGFMLIPTLVALFYHENDVTIFGITTGITLLSGLLMVFAISPPHRDMGKREGFMLTALIWVVFSVFGMLPFIFGSPALNVSEAYFEAMSGFTTTGASVLEQVDNLSHAMHIWRSLMQWIGGMGIILFTLAMLPMLNSAGGMQMFNAEVTGITHDKLKPRVSQTAKRLWGIYTLLTVLLLLLLWIGPMDFFDSICHALSTMSTGGFSSKNNSISEWNSIYVKVIVTIFMFIGGINFAMIYKAASGRLSEIWHNEPFRVYIYAILAIFVAFVTTLAIKGIGTSFETLIIDPLFQVVSTFSSTGYMIPGFETWGAFPLMLVFVMMYFGACAGSTSGGAKIDRFIYFTKNMSNEVYRIIHPNSIKSVSISGRVISPETVNKVTAFLGIYSGVIIIGAIVLTMLDIPFIDALFDAFSCVSNTGLGAGVTGYGGNYDIIPAAGKWILSLLMLTGRLEIFTVIVLFSPGFWRR